jgi:bacteriocin-like protein
MNNQTSNLTDNELDAVSGGVTFQQVALNPQPIPPGQTELAIQRGSGLSLPRGPGCPGPVLFH